MPKKHVCIECCTAMKAEYDKDFDCLIWVCPCCGRQDIEGGCE
jgi:hypothetical protein